MHAFYKHFINTWKNLKSTSMNKIALVIAAVIAILALAYFFLYDSTPNIAELTIGDVSNPNFASGPLIKGQTVIIPLKIKNISTSPISDVSVKANPTISKDGDVIEIINNEVNYPLSIEPGTTGTLDIHVRIVNVPTETATEDVNIELFVDNVSQGNKTVTLSMKQ